MPSKAPTLIPLSEENLRATRGVPTFRWGAPFRMSSTPAAPTPPTKARLTEAEWAEAKIDFELGKMTATQLAAKYGVRRQTMSDGLKARGAIYGAKSKVVEEAAMDAAKSDAQKRVEEIVSMKEGQRKLIETTQRLTQKIIVDSIRDNTPISQKKSDVQTLKNIMAIFAVGRAELWEIYGLNDDKDADQELPEFAVSEYTPEELDAMNRGKGDTELTPDEALAELERQDALEGQGDDPLAGLLDEDEA